MESLPDPTIWQTLLQLLQVLWTLFLQLGSLGVHWIIWIAWSAWWLGGVNAGKMRHALAIGGWAPAILLVILSALVWSRLAPSSWLGMPNFWWQLVYCSLLAMDALFCGWLQDVFGWTPEQLTIDPPAHAHGDDHGDHGHAHH